MTEHNDRLTTKCCGEIVRCTGNCLLAGPWIMARRCIYCRWIWETMPGVEARPLSVAEMQKAHK